MKRIEPLRAKSSGRRVGARAAIGAAAVAGCLSMSAGSAFAVEYADVISSTPVTGQFGVPTQQCQDVAQPYTPPTSGIGAVLGTVAGAVLGNSVGGGAGRALATGAGAIGGAVLGDRVEANGNQPGTLLSRQCQSGMSYENRVIGYDVAYEYRGQRYTARLPQDPGRQLALNVSVAPAGPADVSSPQAFTGQSVDVPIGVPMGSASPAPVYVPAPAYVPAPVVAPAPVYYPAQPYYPAPVYAPRPSVWVQPSLFIGVGGGGRGHWR
jgi:uncharacterized protein YcfJ